MRAHGRQNSANRPKGKNKIASRIMQTIAQIFGSTIRSSICKEEAQS